MKDDGQRGRQGIKFRYLHKSKHFPNQRKINVSFLLPRMET